MEVKNSDGSVHWAVIDGSLPVKVLSHQTAINSIGTLDYGACRNNHTMQVNPAVGVTGGVVTLLISMDGVNWITTTTKITLAASTPQSVTLSATPARFVAADITTAISGGASPSVDVLLGGC